jgi:hypothetical protein
MLAPEPGEPAYASLRALLRSPPALAVDGRPVPLRELHHRRHRRRPARAALRTAHMHRRDADCSPAHSADAPRQAGARLLHDGDFDWPGLRNANLVIRTFGAEPCLATPEILRRQKRG